MADVVSWQSNANQETGATWQEFILILKEPGIARSRVSSRRHLSSPNGLLDASAEQPPQRSRQTLPADVRLMSDYGDMRRTDRKSTRLNSSHVRISYAVFCLKKKRNNVYHAYHTTHINTRDTSFTHYT